MLVVWILVCVILGIKSGPKMRQPERLSRRKYAKSIENDAMLKPLVLINTWIGLFDVPGMRSDCAADHLVCQVNNADEENGRKRVQVRLQPHDNK